MFSTISQAMASIFRRGNLFKRVTDGSEIDMLMEQNFSIVNCFCEEHISDETRPTLCVVCKHDVIVPDCSCDNCTILKEEGPG
jgi:hypothetical protein